MDKRTGCIIGDCSSCHWADHWEGWSSGVSMDGPYPSEPEEYACQHPDQKGAGRYGNDKPLDCEHWAPALEEPEDASEPETEICPVCGHLA